MSLKSPIGFFHHLSGLRAKPDPPMRKFDIGLKLLRQVFHAFPDLIQAIFNRVRQSPRVVHGWNPIGSRLSGNVGISVSMIELIEHSAELIRPSSCAKRALTADPWTK